MGYIYGRRDEVVAWQADYLTSRSNGVSCSLGQSLKITSAHFTKQQCIDMNQTLKICLVLITLVAGCYSDRLPEEIDHLGSTMYRIAHLRYFEALHPTAAKSRWTD